MPMNFCHMHSPHLWNYYWICVPWLLCLIILACIITTWIDLFVKILVASVMYVIQFSLGVLQMLVQELQDLFTLAKAILIMIQQTVSDHYCHKGYISLCKHSQHQWFCFSYWCVTIWIIIFSLSVEIEIYLNNTWYYTFFQQEPFLP